MGSRVHKLNSTFILSNSTLVTEFFNLKVWNKSVYSLDQSIHDLKSVNRTLAVKLRNIIVEGPKHQPLHIKTLYIISGCIVLVMLLIFLVLYKKLKDKKGRMMIPTGVKVNKQTEVKDCTDKEWDHSKDIHSSKNEIEGSEQKFPDVEDTLKSESHLVNSYYKKNSRDCK